MAQVTTTALKTMRVPTEEYSLFETWEYPKEQTISWSMPRYAKDALKMQIFLDLMGKRTRYDYYDMERFNTIIELLMKKGYTEIESSRVGKGSLHRIPSDLLPETAAVLVTGIISVIGSVASAVLTGAWSPLFLAPLIVSAAGGLFVVQAIRRQS